MTYDWVGLLQFVIAMIVGLIIGFVWFQPKLPQEWSFYKGDEEK
jgi:uncharacterized protein YneF (UPF0154 family)